LNYFRSRRRARTALYDTPEMEEPISAEIYSVERLEHHAQALARDQDVVAVSEPVGGPLVPARARGSVGGLWAARHADLAAWQRPGLCAETYWRVRFAKQTMRPLSLGST
jgi:hypothetical protein